MGALPVIADCYRVALTWTATGGQDAVNVMHFRDNTSTATDATIRAALDAAADPGMWGSQVPSAVVTDIAITPLDGIHGTTHAPPATPSKWTGQNGTEWVPAVAAMIKFGTGLRGRSHRGRLFLPFIGESSMADGFLDGTIAANVTTQFADFIADLGAGSPSLDLVIASYKLAQQNTVLTVACETPLGTQRRRQGRLR